MNFLHPPRAVLLNYPFSSLVFVSGMSVYNVVILSILGVAITSIIRDHQDATFAITAVFTIFCTTLTLCFVFLPKVSKGELRWSDRQFISLVAFGDVGAQTIGLNILTFYRAFSHDVTSDPPYWVPKTPINKSCFRGSTSTRRFFVYLIPDPTGISKCWFSRRGENRSTRRKNLGEQGREPTTKLNPQIASTPGLGPHLWEASSLTTAPPLLSVAPFPM